MPSFGMLIVGSKQVLQVHRVWIGSTLEFGMGIISTEYWNMEYEQEVPTLEFGMRIKLSTGTYMAWSIDRKYYGLGNAHNKFSVSPSQLDRSVHKETNSIYFQPQFHLYLQLEVPQVYLSEQHTSPRKKSVIMKIINIYKYGSVCVVKFTIIFVFIALLDQISQRQCNPKPPQVAMEFFSHGYSFSSQG